MKNVYFIFTGDGPLKDQVNVLLKNLNIEKQVFFPGWRNDALELLAISDVYASVSLREGLPMSLLEAMAMRVPAVCYDVDGISEVITHNKTGFLVPPNDINTFAEKLKVLLRNSQLAQRFEAHIDRRDFAEFTSEIMVKKQERLYRSLVPPTKKQAGHKRFFRRKKHGNKTITPGAN